MVLDGFFGRRAENKEKLKQIQDDARLHKIAEDRLKPANERELIRIREQERQEAIAEELKEIRRDETKSFFKSNMFFKPTEQKEVETSEPGNFGRGNMLNPDNMFFR